MRGFRAAIAAAAVVGLAAPAGTLAQGAPAPIDPQNWSWQDELTWNSLFLVMSTGLQSGTGFIFWIITAHLFSVSDVGKGSALISGLFLPAGGYWSIAGLGCGTGFYVK